MSVWGRQQPRDENPPKTSPVGHQPPTLEQPCAFIELINKEIAPLCLRCVPLALLACSLRTAFPGIRGEYQPSLSVTTSALTTRGSFEPAIDIALIYCKTAAKIVVVFFDVTLDRVAMLTFRRYHFPPRLT